MRDFRSAFGDATSSSESAGLQNGQLTWLFAAVSSLFGKQGQDVLVNSFRGRPARVFESNDSVRLASATRSSFPRPGQEYTDGLVSNCSGCRLWAASTKRKDRSAQRAKRNDRKHKV